MIKFKYLFFVISLVFIVSGCAKRMALTQDITDLSEYPITLLSVKISNQHKFDYQLELYGVYICPQSETCIARSHLHMPKSTYKSVEGHYNEYLLSFRLKPGIYNLHALLSLYQGFFVAANAKIPLNFEIEFKPNSIVYLGHINAVLREKKNDNEERATLFPLIDAAVVGYSTGTFDVVIEDKFSEDMKLFITEYPWLQGVTVEKSILPQWVRPENTEVN